MGAVHFNPAFFKAATKRSVSDLFLSFALDYIFEFLIGGEHMGE